MKETIRQGDEQRRAMTISAEGKALIWEVVCGASGSIDCTQTSQLDKPREKPRTRTSSGAVQEGESEILAAILTEEQNTKHREIYRIYTVYSSLIYTDM